MFFSLWRPADFDDLVGRARTGDPEAFASLFERARPTIVERITPRLKRLRGLAQRFDIEDVWSTVLCRGWAHFGQWDGGDERGFVNWLTRIALNHTNSLCRYWLAAKRGGDHGAPAASPSAEWAWWQNVPGNQPTPSADMKQNEEAARVRAAIERLPAELARAIELYRRGHTHKQIAAELGVSRGVLRRRLENAKNRLRKLLTLPDGPDTEARRD